MSAILRLFFAGLIAFVPSPDNKSVQAFLIEAGRDAVFGGCESPRHSPVLAIPAENVVSHACTGSGELVSLGQWVSDIPSGKDVRFCVWKLSDVEVRLVGRLEGGFEKVERGRGRSGFLGITGRDKLPESSSDSVDLSWLANIDDILPDGGDLRAVIGNGSDRDGVAAKINVDRGRLEVCHLVQQRVAQRDVVPAFRFMEVASAAEVGYNQALADVVRAQVRMESSNLHVLLVDERTSLIEEVIDLEAGADNFLDVLLLNMSNRHDPPPPNCAQIGTDFARFFFLANYEKTGDASKYLPHTTSEVQSPSVQPNCELTTLGSYLGLHVAKEAIAGKGMHDEELKRQANKGLIPWDSSRFDNLNERGIKSLETRSVCPMSTF